MGDGQPEICEFMGPSPELAQQLHSVRPLGRLLRSALELLLWSPHGVNGSSHWVAFRWERESEAKTASHKSLLFFFFILKEKLFLEKLEFLYWSIPSSEEGCQENE